MRCPDCNKFVSFEENEPEVESIDVDGDRNVTATVRIVNSCGECGQELKEATLDMEKSFEHECPEEKVEELKRRKQEEYERMVKQWNEQQQSGKKSPGLTGLDMYAEPHVLTILKSREEMSGPDDKTKEETFVGHCKTHFHNVTKADYESGKGCRQCIKQAVRRGEWVENAPKPPDEVDMEDGEYEVDEDGSERTQRGEGSGRYRKTFYGATVEARVKCLRCGEEIEVTLEEYVQASDMDELV